MDVEWAQDGLSDLERIYEFLIVVNERAAIQRYAALVDAPLRLLLNPRLGQRLDSIPDREVRRLIVGDYEIRYEVRAEHIIVLRVWHTREDR